MDQDHCGGPYGIPGVSDEMGFDGIYRAGTMRCTNGNSAGDRINIVTDQVVAVPFTGTIWCVGMTSDSEMNWDFWKANPGNVSFTVEVLE